MKKPCNQRIFSIIVEVFVWIPIFVLVFGALAGLTYQIQAIRFRYPLDYGEAPLVNQAMLLNAGKPIYRPSLQNPPYTITNYPPVYVMILAVFEKWVGPVFWYGRLISTLSALGSAAVIFFIINSRSHNYKLALIPALLFINLPYVLGWSVLARIDHLALFFALIGLYLLFRKTQTNQKINTNLVMGSVFLVLAVYTRQSYALAAPFAGFLYLLQKDWKRSAVLTGLVGGLSLVLFIVFNFLTGGGFYFNIVEANINPFGVERVINHFRNFFDLAPFLFAISVMGIFLMFRKVNGWPMWIGFAFGGFFSAITIGKIGSNINYFLEFAAGLSLLAGFGLTILHQRAKSIWITSIFCLILVTLAWQGVLFIREVEQETRNNLDTRIEAIEELQSLETLVAQNLDQPILADEYMGMLTLNDENLYLQPFEITQLALGGLFDQQILVEQIKEERFSLILLQEDSWWVYALQERWTPEMLEAIRTNYWLAGQFESTFVYKPRTARSVITPRECPAGAWPLPTLAYIGYQYEDGWLTLFGSGPEETAPVEMVAPGQVFRLEQYSEGSLAVVHEDPQNTGEKVILFYKDMLSYRDGEPLIHDRIPVGASGLAIEAGATIGYQSMWSGRINQQGWLHVTLGIAPYEPQFLEDPALLERNLIPPEDYFGIQIDRDSSHIAPIKCLE